MPQDDSLPFNLKEPHISENCCCECVNLKKIKSHPWVNGKPVTEICGYICAVSLHPNFTEGNFEKSVFVYLSNEHRTCELFLKKETPLEKLFNELKNTQSNEDK